MPILMTIVVFFALAVGGGLFGRTTRLPPKEAMARVVGGLEHTEQMPAHPSLALFEVMKKLGNIVPQSPKDVTMMQRRLIRAGYRKEGALKILYGTKAVLGVVLPLLVGAMVAGSSTDPSNKFVAIMIATAVGFFGPNEYVRRVAQRRQKQISR